MSLPKMLTGILAVAINFVPQKIIHSQELPVELRVGDLAPDFILLGSDGNTHRLTDFQGKRIVVLASFPKAFTPGCTRKCRVFAEQSDVFANLPAVFFTASVDSPAHNKKFAESVRAKYPILSDPDRQAALAYGFITTPRDFARRWTFIIGIDGKILHIDKNVKVDTHARSVGDWTGQYLKAHPTVPGGPTP